MVSGYVAWNLFLALLGLGLLGAATSQRAKRLGPRFLAWWAFGLLLAAFGGLIPLLLRRAPLRFPELFWVFASLMLTLVAAILVLVGAGPGGDRNGGGRQSRY